MEKVTNSPEETVKLGFQWGQKILESTKEQKRALVLSLEGKLGSGKTTFVQGLARGLGVKKPITSPSFLIIKKYNLPRQKDEARSKKYKGRSMKSEVGVGNVESQTSSFELFYHIDCYRLKQPQQFLDLGVEDIFKDPKAIVVVEWGEKVKDILPEGHITVKFEHISAEERRITVYNNHDHDHDNDNDS